MKIHFFNHFFSALSVVYITMASGLYAGVYSNGESGRPYVKYEGIEQRPSFPIYGGVIYGNDIVFSENGTILFRGNSILADEGAPYGGAINGSSVTLQENDKILFDENAASSVSTKEGYGSYSVSDSYGGAVYSRRGAVTINDNRYVSFTDNASLANAGHNANSYGGAVYSPSGIIVSGNEVVNFEKNSSTAYYFDSDGCASANGGALYAPSIQITDNGNVQLSGNIASAQGLAAAHGGAICARSLALNNNATVLFAKNVEIDGAGYLLRSIEVQSTASMSAASGASIEIRDSIYVGGNVSFNQNYVNSDGETYIQDGDIIFTGATTEADLLAVKGSVGTEAEIRASRTSEVCALTSLYGGRLRIEDGAIYEGRGITVTDEANATLLLKNGELSHAGYDIIISSGSTLNAQGENAITTSNLNIQEGASMQLSLDMSQIDSAAVLTTTGNLAMGNISFNLTGTEYLTSGDYKLITRTEGLNYDISGWTLNGATSDQLRWENGTLYYTGGHDWNHGVTDDDDINDLGEILGNLIINGGDITLDDVVNAIQDAVDAGFGHGQGHIVINRGGIHISGAGDLDGHIIFNGDLKDIRKLFIEKDINNIKIELGGSSEAENIVDVGSEYTIEIDELSGDGSMSKTGEGEMVIHSKGNKVGGTLDVQEGKLTFTVNNESAGEESPNETEVHELVVGNKDDKEAKVKVDKEAKVKGDKLHVYGKNAMVTNDGSMEFTEEVRVKGGRLDNNGSISRVTLEGGKVTGSGSFAGLEMLGGELVVGNSPGLQTYTDDVELTDGMVTFSLADVGTAATADTHGWGAAAYSSIDMGGNALTLGGDVRFVLEIGGSALETLVSTADASLSFSLSLIQNIDSQSLTLNDAVLAELLGNTSICITGDEEGLFDGAQHLAGRDITSMLSNAGYSYEGNNLVFSATVKNDGSLIVPEPTTATLSLLALAALAARRRRK